MSNDTLNNVMLISVNRPGIAELDAARAVGFRLKNAA